MVGPEQNPVALGELLERDWAFVPCQRVGSWQNGDELLPSELDDWAMPFRWSRADCDVAHPEADGVVEGLAVRVLAQRDRRSRVAPVPALKRRWQYTERD